MKSFKIFSILLLIYFTGCERHNLSPREGYLNITGGKVWYKIIGSGDKTPLVLLHGGPGVPSYYLNPMAALSDERPIILMINSDAVVPIE
jgi:proline iminopeptidase